MRIQHANNIIEIRQKFKKSRDKFFVFVTSDNHFDSKKCDRKRLKRNFDEAKEKNALIVINGDWFDVMGCNKDPRSKPQDIRPEYFTEAGYLDAVVDDAVKFLTPYADNIAMISYGNHETSIIKHHDHDVIKALVSKLNLITKEPILTGAYQGAIKWIFEETREKGKGKGSTLSSIMYYHHGFGGNAPRSKGIMHADILVAQNPFADIIIKGHDHQKWHLPYTVRTMDRNFVKWKEKEIHILALGSYKQKANDFGWEVEKNFNEPTLGGWFIEYELQKTGGVRLLHTSVISTK